MFYNYTLPFDSQSSVQYSKILSAVPLVMLADAKERQNPVPVVLGVGSIQVARSPSYVVITLVGGTSPWSGDFAPDFGEDSVIGGLLVGKSLLAASNSLASSQQYGFLSPDVFCPAAQSQTSSESYLYTASLPLFSQLAYLSNLYFPRLYHGVSAAQSPNVARWGRGLALAFGVNTPSNLFSNEFTNEFGVGKGGHVEGLAYSVGHLLNQMISAPETGAQSTALTNSVSRLLQLASASSALMFLGPGRIFRAVGHGIAARRVLTAGKLAKAMSTGASGVTWVSGWLRGLASPQSPLLTFGGNVYAKLAPTVTTQVLAVGRGIAALRGAISVGRVGAIRSASRLLNAIAASAVGFSRTVGWRRGVASARSVVLLRSAGLPRAVASASVASMLKVAAYLRKLAGVAQAAVAYLAPPAVTVTFFKTLPTLQPSSAHLSTMQAYLRALALTQAQGVGLILGTRRLLVTSSASVADGVRSIAKSVAVSALSVVALSRAAVHFVVAQAFGSVLLAALRASRVIFGTTQSRVSNVSFDYDKFVHVFPNVAMASVASALRLTGKLVGAATRQIAAHIRSFISLALPPVVQLQATSSIASRAVYLFAVQPQRSRVISWFHLFVPDWAYQQTVLLPPSGGPAEPPAFGAIDPADQTTFAFDWRARADFNDPVVSATVISSPAGMTFLGPVFTGGTLVEVTVLPFTPQHLPMIYRLRCTAVFASGRRSSFSIPVPVRNL